MCDLSYIPLREARDIAIFDTGRKYLMENLTETYKGKFVDEKTMTKGNNISRLYT